MPSQNPDSQDQREDIGLGDVKPAHSVTEARKLFDQAEELRAIGNLTEAVLLYKKALMNDPKNPFYHFFIAKAYPIMAREQNSKGFYTLSLDNLRQATKIAPDNVVFHDAKLDLAIKAGFVEDLLREYKFLSEKHPENQFYKEYLKKIGVANLVSIPDGRKRAQDGSGIIARIVVDYLLPLGGSVFIAAGYMIKKYVNPLNKVFVFNGFITAAGAIILVIFACIKCFNIFREK